MFAEIRQSLRPTITLLLVFTVLTGLAYPLLITGISQALMPAAANGSLITEGGHVIGSTLIGQTFSRPGYFHSRPSAAGNNGYDAANSTGSNLAPGSKALATRIAGDIAALRKQDLTSPMVPSDLVTTSASGLDPDISPEAAFFQIPRIARARGIGEKALRQMVEAATQQPLLGLIGERRVNVLQLNRQLDANGSKLAG